MNYLKSVVLVAAVLSGQSMRAQAPSIQWAKCYGGTNPDHCMDVIQTHDGGFMITGWTLSSDGDVIGFHNGGSNVWLVKTDSAGNILWNKCYGGMAGGEMGNSIKQTA